MVALKSKISLMVWFDPTISVDAMSMPALTMSSARVLSTSPVWSLMMRLVSFLICVMVGRRVRRLSISPCLLHPPLRRIPSDPCFAYWWQVS